MWFKKLPLVIEPSDPNYGIKLSLHAGITLIFFVWQIILIPRPAKFRTGIYRITTWVNRFRSTQRKKYYRGKRWEFGINLQCFEWGFTSCFKRTKMTNECYDFFPILGIYFCPFYLIRKPQPNSNRRAYG